jgi:hypothetical protein
MFRPISVNRPWRHWATRHPTPLPSGGATSSTTTWPRSLSPSGNDVPSSPPTATAVTGR